MADNWGDELARIYRSEVAKCGPEGADRRDIIDAAAARIETMILAGELTYSLKGFIHSELVKVDESDGKRADEIIRVAATGERSFEVFDLDVAVTLGRGRRKQWRDVTVDDLKSMNAVRFSNYQHVKASYEGWFKNYRAALPVLVEFRTFGEAVAAGAFENHQSSVAA